MKYPDKVTNISASDNNPIKHGIFVRHLHGGECEYASAQGVHHVPRDNLKLQENGFKDQMYSLNLGDRMSSGDKHLYGFDWVITRVPGGWLYTAETALSPCTTFVPFNEEFMLEF